MVRAGDTGVVPSSPYRFRNHWLLSAPAEAVFAALTDLGSYPAWWTDVRDVRRVDEDTAELVCRAALPYRLVFRLTRAEQNERAGRLRVRLAGDLEGYCGCLVTSAVGGTRLDITQQVVPNKGLLRRLDRVARPAFRTNHALMMRRGARGLRTHLITRGR